MRRRAEPIGSSTVWTSLKLRPSGWTTIGSKSRPEVRVRIGGWSSAGSRTGFGPQSRRFDKGGFGSFPSAGHVRRRWRSMKAKDFDREFDEGKDVSSHLDLSKARRPGREQQRVNVDFPSWMVEALDREASRLGVTRQSIIKVWIADRLERKAS